MSLFISYTHSDDARVRVLKNDLARMGRSAWIDHQIHGGERWWHEIIQQIQAAEVFIFALSNDSWRSRPCRSELDYAEQLRVPVIPVQVGSLDNLRIKIAERQIIDYRDRSADAVLDLMSALDVLAALPRQWPDPLPEPPSAPFEYLHRIAGQIDVHSILPEAQGQLIDELRRRLSDETDALARSDILLLLRQLRDRRELTVSHAAKIDAILAGAEVKVVYPAADGVTRLPPADRWWQDPPRNVVQEHVFLSYSHSGDSAYVESLATHLTQSGIPVWFDKEIVVGDRWEHVIKDRIDSCIALVVVMTPAAEVSMWVSREINYAEAKKKPIFPLLLRGDQFFRLSNIQFENVTDGHMPEGLTSRLRSLMYPSAT